MDGALSNFLYVENMTMRLRSVSLQYRQWCAMMRLLQSGKGRVLRAGLRPFGTPKTINPRIDFFFQVCFFFYFLIFYFLFS